MAETLPDYFQKIQFTSRLGTEEREMAQTLFDKHYAGVPHPKDSRQFLRDLMSKLNGLPVNLQSDALSDKLSVEYWKKQSQKYLEDFNKLLEVHNNEIDSLEKELSELKSAPKTDFVDSENSLAYITSNPSLAWLQGYIDPDKKQTLAEVINDVKRAYDSTIWAINLDPLQLLDEKEYEVLKKWDAETFIPNLENMIGAETLAEYGITDLKSVLTGRHKFMMFWDFVLNDPAEKILQIVPFLTEAQKQILADHSFPSPNIVKQVLADIQKAATEQTQQNDSAEPVQTEKETSTEPGIEPGAGKVIAINRTAGNEEPANNTGAAEPSENKPE